MKNIKYAFLFSFWINIKYTFFFSFWINIKYVFLFSFWNKTVGETDQWERGIARVDGQRNGVYEGEDESDFHRIDYRSVGGSERGN